METFLQWFLPLYLVVYILTAFLWRSYLVWKKTGVNPYALGRTESSHDFVGLLFRLTLILIAAVVLLFAMAPHLYNYLAPIQWLQLPLLMFIGLLLLMSSWVWILIAQAQMGQSWRIGIDERYGAPLIQSGLFTISRNPIFLGMRLTLLGLFLVLPNAVLFATFLLGDALIQIQVRLEEEHLAQTYGEQYQAYCKRTRRWV